MTKQSNEIMWPNPMSMHAFIFNEGNDICTHGECLFRFAVCRVENEMAAQDLVQETFLAAILSRNNFKGKSCLRTWLFGILRHKIMDHLRRRYRERSLPAEEKFVNPYGSSCDFKAPWIPTPEDSRLSPIRQLELLEFRQDLDSALLKLPIRAAKVFQLCEIEGEPVASVCAQLQISPGNLWVALHRARKKLSKELSSWNREDI
jgi:RNA polymerase sigma factor (sigma-70 family)